MSYETFKSNAQTNLSIKYIVALQNNKKKIE